MPEPFKPLQPRKRKIVGWRQVDRRPAGLRGKHRPLPAQPR